ncbi:TolC family outer membrane protein [Sphingomonas sinipercae]|uniref:TolC family outer membrane protein n=1 Tax=Sphingomonas sinipercae TaxID=2714944 RepID=A0A6G7ZM86_9SPHN|nr:TolC family outer membrane protein [Sphingomonas sinipercae]QIL02094.1 TolC family outer membrane protein [Sphingomonas sinipercae]
MTHRSIFIAGLAAALLAGTASADTLREALVSTYRTNPTLTAQREALRATDTTVAIARAAGRPQVSATAGLNRDLTRSGVLDVGGKGPDVSVGVDLSYPIFTGGSVRNQVRGAKARVEAGRATLRAVEGDVFTEAVAVYMDVIRDRAVVELNQNNISVLRTNLEATKDRFEIGDVTRTDVAQSEARLELARSNLAIAQGRLTSSEENYRRVIGHRPDQLAPPPPLPPLPATPEEAVRIALASNPDLLAVNRQIAAAGFDVNVARAGRLPTLSAGASGTYVNDLSGGTTDFFGQQNPSAGTKTTVGVNSRIPLYQGGAPAARIRQAQAIQSQIIEQSIGTERAVIANTRAAYATYRAAQDAIASNAVAVSANELALEGARAERSVGTRTVLDVLNAEQELLNAQVALVTAKRDAYVAGFQLLNAMGQAEADDLGLDGGPLYDPLGNYRRVAGGINDWASDALRAPAATRTLTPAEIGVAPQPLPTPHDQ